MSIQPEAIHDDHDTDDVCLRCQVDPSMPATCPPCIGEVNAARELDDDESHAAECARYEAAWHALGDDEWGDL